MRPRLDDDANTVLRSRATADTDAAMKWMESRLDALAAEVAVGLALLVALYKKRKSVFSEDMNLIVN